MGSPAISYLSVSLADCLQETHGNIVSKTLKNYSQHVEKVNCWFSFWFFSWNALFSYYLFLRSQIISAFPLQLLVSIFS